MSPSVEAAEVMAAKRQEKTGKERRCHVSFRTSLKERHGARHGGDGEDCDECNDKGVTTCRDGEEVVNE